MAASQFHLKSFIKQLLIWMITAAIKVDLKWQSRKKISVLSKESIKKHIQGIKNKITVELRPYNTNEATT